MFTWQSVYLRNGVVCHLTTICNNEHLIELWRAEITIAPSHMPLCDIQHQKECFARSHLFVQCVKNRRQRGKSGADGKRCERLCQVKHMYRSPNNLRPNKTFNNFKCIYANLFLVVFMSMCKIMGWEKGITYIMHWRWRWNVFHTNRETVLFHFILFL